MRTTFGTKNSQANADASAENLSVINQDNQRFNIWSAKPIRGNPAAQLLESRDSFVGFKHHRLACHKDGGLTYTPRDREAQ